MNELLNRRSWVLGLTTMLLLVGWVRPTAATEYFVRKSGNDANNGRDAKHAWLTIDRARRSMGPGDIVHVGAGQYEETVYPRISGQSNRRIRYVADTTGKKTGDAGAVVLAPRNNWSFHIYLAKFTSIEGFTFRAVTSFQNYGVYAHQSDDLTVVKCSFSQGVYYGVYLYESRASITDSSFDQLRTYPVVAYNTDVTIDDCVLQRSGAYAVYHWAPATDTPSHQVHIKDSTITENYGGPAIYYANLILEKTVIERNTYWGAIAAYGNITFRNQAKGITNNGYGLYLAGTNNNRKRTLRGYNFSNNNAYGLYAVNCDVTLQDCVLTGMKSWAVAMVYSSLRTRNSPIRDNAHGLLVYSHRDYPEPVIDDTEIYNNAGTALYHYSYPNYNSTIHVTDCSIRNNLGWAIQSYYGNITCNRMEVLDNRYGMYLINNLAYGPQAKYAFDHLVMKNISQWHAMYTHYADVTLKNSEFRDSTYYGPLVYYGDLRADDCVFDKLGMSSGYAVYHYNDKPLSAASPKAILSNCAFTNSYGGPYSHQTQMTVRECSISGNRYWGLVSNYGELNFQRQPHAINNNGYGLYVAGNGFAKARSFDGWDFSGNGNYGIYGADCNLELRSCKVEKMAGWAIGLSGATLYTDKTPIRYNGHGVNVSSNGGSSIAPTLSNLDVHDNTGIAIYHATNHLKPAKLTVTGCTMRNNGSWPLLSYYSDVAISKCLVEDSPYGFYLYRDEKHTGLGNCAISDTILRNIKSWHAIYAPASSLDMQRCRIENVTYYGLLSYYGNCTLTDCLFQYVGTSSGYAVYHHDDNADPNDRGQLTLRNCSVLDSYGGPYANQTNMTLDNTAIERSKYWALVSNYGDLKLVNQKPVIHNNGYGIYVAGNTSKRGRVLEGWDLSENGAYGVYATDCDLKLVNCRLDKMQSWAACIAYGTLEATNSPIRSSGHGLLTYSSATAKLPTSVTGVEVENCPGYAVYHSSNTAAPATAKFAKCRIRNNGSYSMLSYYGQVDISDTTFEGNRYGLYLYRHPTYGGVQTHIFRDVVVSSIAAWHGIYSHYGILDLKNVTVDKCSNYGVLAYYADVKAEDCQFTNNVGGYAVYLYDDPKKNWDDRARTTLKNCVASGNYGGPYANYTHLTLDKCKIEQNKYWGVACAYGDFQILNQALAINNNGYGLYLAGNTPKGNRFLKGFDVSKNGSYGIYAELCDLTLEDCRIEEMAGWAAALVYGNLKLINSPIRNNGNGLLVYSRADRGTVQVDDLESYDNKGTGLYHSSHWPSPGQLTINRCSVKNNAGWGFLSYYGNVICNASVFDGNYYGIQVYRHPTYGGVGNHQFTDVVVQNTKAWHGLYSPYGQLALTRCQIRDNNNYGVLCYYASCSAEDCAFTGNGKSSGYAIYNYESNADRSLWPSMVLKNCEFTANYGGPYAHQSNLTIDNCKIEANKYWAVVCSYGGLTVQNQDKAIHKNGYGIYLAGNDSKEGRVLKGWDVSDNGAYGVYAVDCDLMLENCKVEKMRSWAVGLNLATLRTTNSPITNNAHGIYVYSKKDQRSPSLTGVTVSNTSGYAVYHSSDSTAPGKLTMRNCRVENSGTYGLVNQYGELDAADTSIVGNRASSVHGLYSYRSPKFMLERVAVINHSNWGFLSYGNNVTAKNSIIGNNAYGLYLYNYAGQPTTAAIVNCTLGNNDVYGVLQYNGQSSFVNNVLSSGARGSYGLYVSNGVLNHDYNALHGYSNPHYGTSISQHEVVGHPRFTNPSAGDFTLLGSSVAINRGVDLPGDVDYDMLGFRRPQYGKWELGAYEYTKPTDSAHIVKWTEVK